MSPRHLPNGTPAARSRYRICYSDIGTVRSGHTNKREAERLCKAANKRQRNNGKGDNMFRVVGPN